MKKKLRVGILFGGRSGEHEISLRSAASILQAIDRSKYEIVPLGITPSGRWLGGNGAQAVLAGSAEPAHAAETASQTLALEASSADSADAIAPTTHLPRAVDVLFPVLHGTFGEDGTIQGLLELADIPYVGSGVLGSAAGMDKAVMKQLFAAAGLPQTPHLTLLRRDWKAGPAATRRLIGRTLQYPLFVKPANLGSSVGISKVKTPAALAAALDLAASFDRKLVVEQGVGGPGVKPRELEVAVLGNDSLEASVVGEIIPAKEFYDYEAKYQLAGPDESVATIPAKIPAALSKQIRALALQAFRACDCSGLARVDFLMDPNHPAGLYLNEINTMPGFTSISMYPKLWQASGLSYRELIDRLITLALERHAEKQATSFTRA